MITPTDHLTKTRTVLGSPSVRSRRQQNSPDKSGMPKPRNGRNMNPAPLVKPVPTVSRNSPKHSLYSNSTHVPDDSRYASSDRFPERSRRRSRKVDHTYRLPPNCAHRVSLPPLHRCSSFLTRTDDIQDEPAYPAPISRPYRANSWMRPNKYVSPFRSGRLEVDGNRNKRKVEFLPASPQIIGEGSPVQSDRVHTNQSPDAKPSPRTVIKSILKKQCNYRPELHSRQADHGSAAVRLPNIDRTNYRSAGRSRNSATRWRGRTRTSPGISFTCSKEFAKVFENLERDGELPDIHRKGSNL